MPIEFLSRHEPRGATNRISRLCPDWRSRQSYAAPPVVNAVFKIFLFVTLLCRNMCMRACLSSIAMCHEIRTTFLGSAFNAVSAWVWRSCCRGGDSGEGVAIMTMTCCKTIIGIWKGHFSISMRIGLVGRGGHFNGAILFETNIGRQKKRGWGREKE